MYLSDLLYKHAILVSAPFLTTGQACFAAPVALFFWFAVEIRLAGWDASLHV
jgi:hypothetical protein